MTHRIVQRLAASLLAAGFGLVSPGLAQVKDGITEPLRPAAAVPSDDLFNKFGSIRTVAADVPSPALAPAPAASPLTPSYDCVGCQDQGIVINLSPGSCLMAIESRLNVFGLPPSHDLAENNAAFVDSALIGNRLRLRYDSLWTNSHPDRADFITARNRSAGNGRGFLRPETNLDMQEFMTYVEMMLSQRASVFFEVPLRSVNPEVNPNRTNFGDLNAGFKVAYSVEAHLVQTFQLRVFIPSGSAAHGIGVGHPSLEPALLVWQRLPWGCTLEAEVRDWIAINGTMNSGNVLRYGLALSRNFGSVDGSFQFKPIAELIGWTVLRGQESIHYALDPEFTRFQTNVQDTRSTVINLNLGVRFGSPTSDVYLGWTHAMTGPAWFAEGLRLEYRWHF
ncbi:MAG TPA: hypothetical protein PKD86_10570 [Gemmatales bacterium]|nr:hypothetical protein [Gemmatales bacterium]